MHLKGIEIPFHAFVYHSYNIISFIYCSYLTINTLYLFYNKNVQVNGVFKQHEVQFEKEHKVNDYITHKNIVRPSVLEGPEELEVK